MRDMHKSIAQLFVALLLALCALLLAAFPALATDDERLVTLVNKEYVLGMDYAPNTLVSLSSFMSTNSGVKMCSTAAQALEKLVNAARAEGITDVYAISGYRSYGVQSSLYSKKITYYRNLGYNTSDAQFYAATVVAPPGASEHQTGLAIDFGTSENGYGLTESFATTAFGQWLYANSWKYGFILRYPKDGMDITGYIYEPWHFRYVGAPHAEYMTKQGLTLEEYYALLIDAGTLEITTWDGTVYQVTYNDYYPQFVEKGSSVSVAAAGSGGGYISTTRVGKVNFADLLNHWSEKEVCVLIRLSVISGYSDDTFRPNNQITRAELLTLVAKVQNLLLDAGENYASLDAEEFAAMFADVYADSWYLDALQKTYHYGLVQPLLSSDETGRYFLHPSRYALRREVAQCLAPLFENYTGESEGAAVYLSDLEGEDEALRDAVDLLVAHGVIQGRPDGKFYPDATITRAEVSAMLYRILQSYAKAGQGILADLVLDTQE